MSSVGSMIKFTPKGCMKEKASLLLIGNKNYCKLIDSAIEELNNGRRRIEMTRICCENVDTVLLSSIGNVHVDFIVFLLDTSEMNCLKVIKDNITKVDSIYTCGRILIANCNNQITPITNSVHNALTKLCKVYNLFLIHDDITDPTGKKVLAERILNVFSTACGLECGLPMSAVFPANVFTLE